MTSRTGNSRGFTLIEVMVTVVILTLGIMGILRAYAVSLHALGISADYIDAICLSKEKMAEIEMDKMEYAGLREGIYRGKFNGRYKGFGWETEILPSGEKGLNLVNVSVFDNRPNPLKIFRLVTYAGTYDRK